MIFTSITDDEMTELEDVLINIYKEQGINEDNDSLLEKDSKSAFLNKRMFKAREQMPKMEDLFNELKKNKKLKKYTNLLKPYCKGSFSCLNGYTNVDIENKVVVADIHNVQENEITIVMFVLTEYFWDAIKKDRSQKKILYLDEVWKMINKNEYTADFVFKLFKTIRKYGGGATAITQYVSDFFMLNDGKYGKSIINNSSCKCLFQLEENDIALLEKVLNISEDEKYKLLNLKRGTTIIHAGRNTLMADIISSPREHEYVNTSYT